jgi:Lrp/AsnC family transcriptional regulator for asnA, asnC and gidA
MKNINNSVTIDGIDKEIIRSLMTNARTPILEIAKKLEFQELQFTKD